MTEGQREAPDRPEAERYYAQHASLDVGEGGSSEAAVRRRHCRRRSTRERARAGSWSA
jgi:hypothetical protein